MPTRRRLAIILLVLLPLAVGAILCLRQHPAPRGITADSVKNIAYPIDMADAEAGPLTHPWQGTELSAVTLTDGRWAEPVTWSERWETTKDWWAGNVSSPWDYRASRDRLEVESSVIGTLNGKPAAAVIYGEDGGGSGLFMSLGLVVEQDGAPVCVATAGLGDRTQVLAKKFDQDRIALEVLRVGENDSMAEPTDHVRLTYVWDGKRDLTLVSTEKLAPLP